MSHLKIELRIDVCMGAPCVGVCVGGRARVGVRVLNSSQKS